MMTSHKQEAFSGKMHGLSGHKEARSLLICIILLFIVLCLPAQGDTAAAQKGFLWKVQSKTATVYLLGSIHVFKKEFYPLPGKIEEAFQGSDTLVVEADIDDVSLGNIMTMLEGAFYPENETLETHLSKDAFRRAEAKLAEFGVPLQLFQRSKPWILALMITSLQIQKSGFDPEYGIDKHFLGEARDRKRILELESIGYQMDLFSGFSDAEQEAFLLYTLKDVDSMKEEMDVFIRAWNTGDTRALESMVTKGLAEDPGISPVYEKLFYERNRNMASRIDGFLKARGKYFVVVGAGHLVGEKGIPGILKGKGYSVEQL
jgi:uncharacterized protein YbaP (TraB family)